MTSWRINGRDIPADMVLPSIGGRPLPRHRAVRTPKGMWVFLRGRTYFVEAVRQVRSHVGESSVAGDGTIASPMPGKIFKLLVAEGDAVKAGQDIVILEAMKMEHALRAPRDGKIAGLKIVPGELVEAGQTLAVVVA